jgi:hypothetical protein
MIWPWEQFSWGVFWAVLAALVAWEVVKWLAFGLFALVIKAAE